MKLLYYSFLKILQYKQQCGTQSRLEKQQDLLEEAIWKVQSQPEDKQKRTAILRSNKGQTKQPYNRKLLPTNSMCYFHFLEFKLLPCLSCQALDDQWVIVKDTLAEPSDDPKAKAAAQTLTTVFLADLRRHYVRNNLAPNPSQRKGCLEFIE